MRVYSYFDTFEIENVLFLLNIRNCTEINARPENEQVRIRIDFCTAARKQYILYRKKFQPQTCESLLNFYIVILQTLSYNVPVICIIAHFNRKDFTRHPHIIVRTLIISIYGAGIVFTE